MGYVKIDLTERVVEQTTYISLYLVKTCSSANLFPTYPDLTWDET
jgi:hypothetical protein